MGDIDKWASAALRVFSAGLTPEELAAALGVVPGESLRAGDPVSSRSRAVRETNAVLVSSGLPGGCP